jgi:formylglycine-generating enzyme required for sulfatase activity
MGSDDGGLDEKPMRRVSVSSFALAKTEVTQGQWRAVMGNNPSFYSSCGDDCPVENVSWDDAQDFVGRISEKTGQTYRLPSEAEWEYACRAGGRHDYCGSDNVDAVAWYQNNSMEFKSRLLSASEWVGGQTSQVAKKQANAWGLFDMSGNLWEWVEDCYYGNYVGAPTDGSAWTSGACKQRVLRGGSWNVNPRGARSTSRYRLDTTYRFSNFSFRPARIISH